MKKSRLLCAALAVAALAASAFAMAPPVASDPPGFPRAQAVNVAPAAAPTVAATGTGASSAFKAYEAQRGAMPAPAQRVTGEAPGHVGSKVAPAVASAMPPAEPRVVYRLRWLRT